ncbi:MAG: CAP domain-containing protein [Leptolyngbyaceae cyanobacterium]
MPKDRAGNTLNRALRINNVPGKSVAKDWIGQSDKVDFYTFSLSKSSSIKLNLGKLKDNLDLELLDFQGNRITRSKRPKFRKEKIRETLDAGTYYVKVSGRGSTSSYQLKSVFQGIAETDISNPDVPNPDIPSLPPPVLDPTDAGGTPPSEDATSKADRVALINEVLALTNVERTNSGLSALTLNPLLNNSAQIQSEDLALNDFFAHTSPTGVTLGDRLNTVGYQQYQLAGENIAAGQTTADQVVQEWMNSPGHRANILNPNFTEMGVGYYFLAQDTGEVNYNRYWTQNFGTPMD